MKTEPVTNEALDRALQNLSREVMPRRDLWDGVAAQMLPARTSRFGKGRIAMSAAAGFAVGAALLWISMGLQWRSYGQPNLIDSQSLVAVRSAQVDAYRTRLPLLDAKTRERVERDLAVIKAAEADIAAALKTEPTSAVLSRLYEGTVRQEFDLYETIVRATDTVIPRTRT